MINEQASKSEDCGNDRKSTVGEGEKMVQNADIGALQRGLKRSNTKSRHPVV